MRLPVRTSVLRRREPTSTSWSSACEWEHTCHASGRRREAPMGFDDKFKDVAGKAKEWVGEKTGDEQLEAEGKRDQAVAKTKEAVEAVKDDLGHKFDTARDKLSEKAGELSDKVAEKAAEVKDRTDG